MVPVPGVPAIVSPDVPVATDVVGGECPPGGTMVKLSAAESPPAGVGGVAVVALSVSALAPVSPKEVRYCVGIVVWRGSTILASIANTLGSGSGGTIFFNVLAILLY